MFFTVNAVPTNARSQECRGLLVVCLSHLVGREYFESVFLDWSAIRGVAVAAVAAANCDATRVARDLRATASQSARATAFPL